MRISDWSSDVCSSDLALAGDGRKAGEQGSLLAHLGEDLRLGVAGDFVRDGEGAVGSPAFGMHAALGDNFAIEVRQLLDQPDVLEQRRRSEEHTSELQSLMRISYAVFCLKKKKTIIEQMNTNN